MYYSNYYFIFTYAYENNPVPYHKWKIIQTAIYLKINSSIFVCHHIFRRRVDRDVKHDAFLRHMWRNRKHAKL